MEFPQLADPLAELRRSLILGERIILGIAGAPGSGKSTCGAWVQQQFDPGVAVVVPMDGFHLGNAIIAGTPLRNRKGAIDTFDGGGYLSLLRRLHARDEEVVYAPEFRRTIDEPVAATIAVPASTQLVITEGNYLLIPDHPWSEVRELLTESWFLETPEATRLERLVARHVVFGMAPDAAADWANGPDQANADLIQATRHRADRIISWA